MNPNDYDWMSEGISPKDAPAWMEERARELGDILSPLMKRLAEIMPKKPEPKWEPNKLMLSIDYQPIRVAAESFASWMGDELPANREELRAMLWAFGEILNGEMERMLNVSNRLQSDLLATLPVPTTFFKTEKL